MAQHEIANGKFTARVDTLGAQLVSLKGPSGREYLWEGDPAYWGEHAPVLFPIVGALRDGRTEINGNWYEMTRHGFAKRREFPQVSQTADSISLTLTADQETKKAYPFEFSLTVTYTLTSEGFRTAFSVENPGPDTLPFSIGGHPGFALPMEDGAVFEDYTLQFDGPESQQCPTVCMDTGLLDYETPGFALSGQEVPLRHSLFYHDALVFENLHSHRVRIINKKTGRGVEMDFTGFPLLGVWSAANDGPYVCLEPWTGCATLTTEGDRLVDKKNTTLLPPGETFRREFAVRFL